MLINSSFLEARVYFKYLKIMEVSDKSFIWCAVVNVFAASKKAGTLWRKAEKGLADSDIPFHSVTTGDAGNAMTVTCKACEDGYRRFIAVGGDGTVHDVLNGIMCFVESRKVTAEKVSLSDFTFAVIPVGSGNDWIKSHGIPCDMSKAILIIRNGSIGKQDVIKASVLEPSALPAEKILQVSYMANVGGVGLDADVCDRVNRKKQQGKRGKKLYVSALLYNIIHRVPSRARVLCDGNQVFDGTFLSMAFGVGRYSGGGMRQTAAAVVDDGLLDMTIIPELPLLKIAKEAPKLFTGTFLTVKELVVSKAKSITVVPYDEALPCSAMTGGLVEVDGEVIGHAPVRFDVYPEQLNILVP